jgi:hypothetical protein
MQPVSLGISHFKLQSALDSLLCIAGGQGKRISTLADAMHGSAGSHDSVRLSSRATNKALSLLISLAWCRRSDAIASRLRACFHYSQISGSMFMSDT